MYIIISTSTRHHIILKGSRDSTSHIKEFIIQDKHHFFPKKLHYLRNQQHLRNSPYKSIHLKKKKILSSFSFEISLEFLKFLIFFLNVILSLEFWISLSNFEFFFKRHLSWSFGFFFEILNFFFFESFKFFTTIKSHQHNGSHQVWFKHIRR